VLTARKTRKSKSNFSLSRKKLSIDLGSRGHLVAFCSALVRFRLAEPDGEAIAVFTVILRP
ncbi:MAG: hypothetical protein ACRDHN_02745, partial [Thermomicrobiales bacterium]